jgi:hypothetical protein
VFQIDGDHAYFLQLLDRYRQPFPVRLLHYCSRDTQFHLLPHGAEPRPLSPFMAGLLRAYVHDHHRPYGFIGHLWQGRFQSPVVAVEESFLRCARYIERNPLVAALVTEPWQYRCSSCPAYALGPSDPLLSYNVWYRGLGANAGKRQQRWRQFLLGDDPHEAVVCRADWIVDDEAFRRRRRTGTVHITS